MYRSIFIILLIFIAGNSSAQSSQPDTITHKGFRDYEEAGDTLFARLLRKNFNSIREFTVSENAFTSETRKHDTIIPIQMIHGQYVYYWGLSDRSYAKLHKKVLGKKVKEGKTKKDTILLYPNYGEGVQRAELYISHKNFKAYIKYQLWLVNGLWYFTGKFELVDESPEKK